MTWTPNRNGTNPLHQEGPREQGTLHDSLRATDTTSEPSRTIDVPRGPGSLPIRTQHCILCQAETVGACLICHRPLCEQCGRSDDEFLRSPTHCRDEVEALRSTLRQAALSVIGTKRYVEDLVALRNRVLQEVSTALLRAYVEQSGRAPSPSHVQQMRRVAFALWNSLSCVQDADAFLMADPADSGHEHKERVREGQLAGQEEMRPPEKERPV